HRDVKPGNVMLAPGGRVVLMDFGLVLPHADRAGYKSIAGSLQYMAPEAMTGEMAEGAANLGDVYALGVLGFELLTGIAPVDGEEPTQIYRSKMRTPQPRVSEYRPEVSPAVDDAVAQLMAPLVRDRPHGAEEALWLLRSLQRHAGDESALRPFSVLVADHDP